MIAHTKQSQVIIFLLVLINKNFENFTVHLTEKSRFFFKKYVIKCFKKVRAIQYSISRHAALVEVRIFRVRKHLPSSSV